MPQLGRAARPTSTAAGLALAAAVFAAPDARAEQVSPHAFQNVLEHVKGSVVRITSAPAGTAVLIGVSGQLLAPATAVRKGALTIELGGEKREAKLVAQDSVLGLALLALESGEYPAATVGSAARLAKGAFLFGVSFDGRGKLATAVGHFQRARKGRGGATHLVTDVGGPAGSAVFNARGELVAVHAGAPLATIPVEELKQRFAPAPRSP